MRIGCFTNIRPDLGICRFDESVFGACIDPMSRIYPGEFTVQFHPSHVEAALERFSIEAIFFNHGYCPEYTPAVLEATKVAQARGVRVFAFDGDPYSSLFRQFAAGVELMVDVYRQVDAVLVRHPLMIEAIRAVTARPVVQWFDPLTPLEYYESRPAPARRDLIVIPLSVGFPNWEGCRLALMNYLIAAALQKQFPQYDVAILKGPRDDVAAKIGLRATFCEFEHAPQTPDRRVFMLDMIQEAKLFVGIDWKASYGQWIVDAMSAGTPSIHTDFVIAGHLRGDSQAYPFDLGAAVSRGAKLLEDPEEWRRDSERALQVAETFRPSSVRRVLEQIIADLPPREIAA